MASTELEVVKISNLPAAPNVSDTDVFPVSKGGATYKMNYEMLESQIEEDISGMIDSAVSAATEAAIQAATDANNSALDAAESAAEATEWAEHLVIDPTPTQGSTNPVGSGGVYAALAGKQDTLTFDSTPTANSQNPVTSAGIKAAIDEAAGNSDKAAPVIISSASGDIATFSDGADDMPIKSLAVNVEPVQDLHSYDRPWVAGAGKNILPPHAVGTTTSNGITWTVNADGTVVANGTATANSTFYIPTTEANIDLQNTQYILNGCPANGGASTYRIIGYRYKDGEFINTFASDYGSGVTLDPTDGTFNQVHIALRVNSGVTATNLLFKPMLRLATEADDTYEPYENICPISGWTEANVTRAGKNLIPNIKYQSNANNVCLGKNNARYELYLPKGTYTLSIEYLNGAHSGAYYRFASDSANRTIWASTSTSTSKTFTIDKDEPFNLWLNQTGGISANNIGNFQIELGSTATTYEEYAGETFPVALPTEAGTVYGGVFDPVKGKLTVEDVSYAFKGTETIVAVAALGDTTRCRFNNSEMGGLAVATNGALYCSHGVCAADHSGDYVHAETTTNYTYLFVPLASATAAQVQAYLQAQYEANTPWQIVYKLATPLEYTLTPQEITTLLGYNTIYADCGSIADVEYPADTKKYIDNKFAELQALILENT